MDEIILDNSLEWNVVNGMENDDFNMAEILIMIVVPLRGGEGEVRGKKTCKIGHTLLLSSINNP